MAVDEVTPAHSTKIRTSGASPQKAHESYAAPVFCRVHDKSEQALPLTRETIGKSKSFET